MNQLEIKQQNSNLKSVLILEDELMFGRILQHLVKSIGSTKNVFRITAIEQVDVFLATCNFDLLISDIDVNSSVCTPHAVYLIKQRFPQLKIIMISANERVNAQDYLHSGADHFLKKTENIKLELTVTIKSLFSNL